MGYNPIGMQGNSCSRFITVLIALGALALVAVLIPKSVRDRSSVRPGWSTRERTHVVFDMVYIHKTSATTYVLCDKDGFGLVNGKIVRLYMDRSHRILIVGYVPFDLMLEEVASASLRNLSFASICCQTSGPAQGPTIKAITFDENGECMVESNRYRLGMLENVEQWLNRQ